MAIKTTSSARESSGTKSTKKNSANSRPDKSTPAAAKRAASSKRSTATPLTGSGDRVGCVEIEPSDKDRNEAKKRLFVRSEEIVAPGDCTAHGAQAIR